MSTIRAFAAGTGVGLIVASWMTMLDWRLNPGGIFRGAEGTNWSIVIETGLSWFVPVAVAATALVLILQMILRRRS